MSKETEQNSVIIVSNKKIQTLLSSMKSWKIFKTQEALGFRFVKV